MGKPLTVGSLFAGIGGFDLAAERVGWQVKWQVEIDDYATKVLEKHWPHVRRYRDIRTIDWSAVEPVDVVCGGFPCQPHSLAGRRLAAADDRDLWPEVKRCLRALRPRRFVGENVSGLLSSDGGRFFGTVLRDLAAIGFDVEWDCIPASAVGAPHRRDRVWIVAHAAQHGQQTGLQQDRTQYASASGEGWLESARGGVLLDHPNGPRLEGRQRSSVQERAGEWPARARGASVAHAASGTRQRQASRESGHTALCGEIRASEQWRVEPNVGRVAHGVPARVDRLRGLGNAIVPQVAEWIFRQIQAADEGERVSG